jgi:DNA-directed RNA polymerase specialized sigma24 family protein
MNDMMQTVRPGAFETALLAHVETCYAVACALTRSPAEARDLTRDTILWAWRFREDDGALPDIKRCLLVELRRRFLLHYRRPPGMTTAVAAERM